MKKLLILLGLIVAANASLTAVMAHSTIYTDELGRMHFLGKDPGGKTLQQVENYNNPAQKDLTNIIYKNEEVKTEETKVNSVEHTNKSKGSFTFDKGAMDASNPYTYGNTNIKTEPKTKTEKKHFWDNW